MATNPTVADLFKRKVVTDQEIDAAVDAVLADPRIGPVKVASGCIVDLTAAVQADRHASATLREPTAKAAGKRAAVKSAILLARSVKG